MPDPFMLKTLEELETQCRNWSQAENPLSFLTGTSKMNCPSFSLPFAYSCPGSRASFDQRRGICKLCYAAVGNYAYANVKAKLVRNFRATERPDFVQKMIAAVADPLPSMDKRARKYDMDFAYFRVHDSGDFHSPEYIRAWKEIVAAHPKITFWIPTRVWAMKPTWRCKINNRLIRRQDMIAALAALSREPNVVLRPSMLLFDEPPDWRPGMDRRVRWSFPTGAFLWKTEYLGEVEGRKSRKLIPVPAEWTPTDPDLDSIWARKRLAFPCPAGYAMGPAVSCMASMGPGGETGCRACWDAPMLPIAYKQHGSFKGKRQ
jgi:hypothetical protein